MNEYLVILEKANEEFAREHTTNAINEHQAEADTLALNPGWTVVDVLDHGPMEPSVNIGRLMASYRAEAA